MKILNLDNWCEEATEILSGNELVELGTGANDYQGIIANLNCKLNEDVLKIYPDLKFIASCTTGLDHINTEYCKAKGIKIISLQGETEFLSDVWATAEHTWALIMSLIRKVPWAFDDVKQGNWDREAFQGVELRGKTLGIVGHGGRIGQQLYPIAKAFGMNVLGHDTVPDRQYKISVDTETLLQNSDIITVHVPLNDETKGMFGVEQFRQMKPTAYFVNTSRGGVVEEGSLISALLEKRIAGAALDVATGEPNIWEQLRIYARTENNLILTPHCSGNTRESREKTQIFLANRIKDYINTKESVR